MILLTDSVQKVRIQNEKSEYILQEGFVGAVPANSPEFLLVMVTHQDDVGPTPQITRKKSSIEDFGKTLLGNVYKFGKKIGEPKSYVAASIPVQQDRANYNQFLISSRIDFQEHGNSGSGRVKVMPQLVGLSLRKGLQRINEYDLHVKIQGSGQIVSQMPRPGEPLQGIGECVLTLDSEI